jgi:hypothetical protein
MSQYELQQNYKLSLEMMLAICWIAQQHSYRDSIKGNTLIALRKRKLVDRQKELTENGWDFYLSYTQAGPCPTTRIDGYVFKDPQSLYDQAKPRLEKNRAKKEADERLAQMANCGASILASPNLIFDLMNQDELELLGIAEMSEEQRKCLLRWLIRHKHDAQDRIFDISSIKYGGRLIILKDGTRWDVEDCDSEIAELWLEADRVILIDGEMFKLDELEKVAVEQSV